MLSVKKCHEILNKNGEKNYSEEEVKQIRELLYKIGHFDYMLFKQQTSIYDKSHHLHQSING
jgi:hypothetical protein